MSKFHINKKGDVTQCRAKKKCPFGGESGVENHYQTKVEAQKAYENQMAEKLKNLYNARKYLKTLKGNELNHITYNDDLNIDENIVNVTNFIKAVGVNNFTIGKVTSGGGSEIKEYEKTAKKLVDIFTTRRFSEEYDGYYSPPISLYEDDEYYYKNQELEGTGFKVIGSGARNNAYLHEESGMVYKIPNFDYVMDDWNEDNSPVFIEQNVVDAEVYQKLNVEELKKENIEYAKTHYIYVKDENETEVPIIVQEYLSPNDYDKFKMTREEQRDIEQRYRGLWDLHSGNVRRNKKTGRIVLIDCI